MTSRIGRIPGNDERDAYDLGTLYEKLKLFLLVNVRWFTRAVMVVIVTFLILHLFYPPSIEWVGDSLDLARPSLAAILALVVAVWLLERVIVLQGELRRPPVAIHGRRVLAYRYLSEAIERRGARRVELIQVSGQTAVRLLRDLGESRPKAEIRLLLLHPGSAAQFDRDQKPDHRDRILTTVGELDLLRADYPKMSIEAKYYTTPPSVSAVVVDEDIVSISWYHSYKDPDEPDVTRIRGHLNPTITALGDASRSLLSFARQQFETLWETAESTYE